jgi:hypothetical protein
METADDHPSSSARLTLGCHSREASASECGLGVALALINKSRNKNMHNIFLRPTGSNSVTQFAKPLRQVIRIPRGEVEPPHYASRIKALPEHRNTEMKLSTEERRESRCKSMNGTLSTERSNTHQHRVNLTRPFSTSTALVENLGIDKVLLRFPVEEGRARVALGSATSVIVSNTRELGYQAKFARGRDGKHWGFLSFNPSRWLLPNDWRCPPAPMAISAIYSVFNSAEPLLRPLGSVSDAEVKRLDIARDFEGVECPAPYLMRRDVEGRSVRNLNWSQSVSASGGRTIRGWNKSGSIQLYDKHRQSHAAAPNGTLRFEVQLRQWLTRYGVQVTAVADITPANVEAIAQLWWAKSEFGTALMTDRDVYACLREYFGENRNAAALANSTYGYFARLNAGLETSDVPPNTRRRYNHALRSIHLPLIASSHAQFGEAKWLDLVSGTEVVISA